MRTDQQEFLIQSIRAGTVHYNKLRIVPATIDQQMKSCEIFSNTYDRCLDSGVMTEEQMEQWMIATRLLPFDFKKLVSNFNKEIDNQKLSLYKSRANTKKVNQIRYLLNELRSELLKLARPKSEFSQNTCEFIAHLDQRMYILRCTTMYGKKKYTGSNFTKIFEIWQDSLLSEKTIRELARCYSWKSIWNIYKFNKVGTLFKKHGRRNTELTVNQKNILTWSNIYDNVAESMDCPSEDVINDDDMLDGWFIDQKNKREKESKKDIISDKIKSGKINNSNHVFVVANDEEAGDLAIANGPIMPEQLIDNQPGVIVQ
jgi:hypothetical protein